MKSSLGVPSFCLLFLALAGISYSQIQCEEGWRDCGPGSDECVRNEDFCDWVWSDCSNGWDETPENCPCDGFLCTSEHKCIPLSKVCNFAIDCFSAEDEKQNCPPCRDWEFHCPNTTRDCINKNQVCNGRVDCPGGEDELGPCPNKTESVSRGTFYYH